MIFKHAFGAVLGFSMSLFATPAAADETATAAQIAGSVSTQTPLTGGAEFRELFASWKSIEEGKPANLVASYQTVSIPSRMPVEGVRLTSGYGMRDHPVLRQRRNHKGVDLAGPTGTPVYATADGVVARASRFGSYGNYIQIEHGGELQTRYAHLSGYEVAAGERVTKGQLIGYVGSTGRSTGPHLHYEVRVSGEAVNPIPYMTATQLAQLEEGEGGRGGPE